MEEDIKVVEGLCRCFRYEQSKLDELDRDNYADFIQEDEIKAIENLIADNKRLDKENQALFEAYNFNDTNLLAKILKEYRKEIKDSIPKSKIRKKKEEAKEYEKNVKTIITVNGTYYIPSSAYYKILQKGYSELLQEGDK